jgi:predicted HicB family RNase H-like nuclease
MTQDHYTYRVTWSPSDDEWVATCVEFGGLSWLEETPGAALDGLRGLVASVVADLQDRNKPVPEPLAHGSYSGRLQLRMPPELHRGLTLEAAEAGISLNRLINYKLAAPAAIPTLNERARKRA